MGLKNLQWQRSVENIVKNFLYRGRQPGFETITYHLGRWLQEHKPGAPSFQPYKVWKRKKTDPYTYNRNVMGVSRDLEDLYQVSIQQHNQVMNTFNENKVRRQKIEHDLTSLNKRMDELLLAEERTGNKYLSKKIIDFDDMSYVNQSESTTETDLTFEKLHLKHAEDDSKKVLIQKSQAVFKPLQRHKKNENIKSIGNAFDDHMNTSWRSVVKASDPEGMTGHLDILFEKVTPINQVSYVPHNGRPLSVDLEYTKDGENFYKVPSDKSKKDITEIASWSFPLTEVLGMRFIMEKKEHDDFSSGYYQYYFGAKDISIFKNSYQKEGTYVSKAIGWDPTHSAISIETKDTIHTGTSINYEIGLAQENQNEIKWMALTDINDSSNEKPKVIELNGPKKKSLETTEAEHNGQYINGMKVFRLKKSNGDSLIENLHMTSKDKSDGFDDYTKAQLFRGINQWKRERTYVPFIGEVPIKSMWTTKEENNPSAIKTDYLPIENTLNLRRYNGGHAKDNYFRFTTCIYSMEEKSTPLSVGITQLINGKIKRRVGTYHIYVNNESQKPVHDEIRLTLKQGWNQIEVLLHLGDVQRNKDFSRDDIPTEAYLGKYNIARNSKIRADYNPLSYIDAHSLYHNVAASNHDYFSIYEQNIVLNYMPMNCIFQLVYEDKDEMNGNMNLVVRAHLDRGEYPHLTPTIERITIRSK